MYHMNLLNLTCPMQGHHLKIKTKDIGTFLSRWLPFLWDSQKLHSVANLVKTLRSTWSKVAVDLFIQC